MEILKVYFCAIAYSPHHPHGDLKHSLFFETDPLKKIYLALARSLRKALESSWEDLSKVQIELDNSIVYSLGHWKAFIGSPQDPFYNQFALREWFAKAQKSNWLEKWLRDRFNRPKTIYEFVVRVERDKQSLTINFYPRGEKNPFDYEFQVN